MLAGGTLSPLSRRCAEATEEGGEDLQRAKLLSDNALLDKSSARLADACRTAHEAESTGAAVLQALVLQREQLERTRANLGKTHGELSQSEMLLKRMGWNGHG